MPAVNSSAKPELDRGASHLADRMPAVLNRNAGTFSDGRDTTEKSVARIRSSLKPSAAPAAASIRTFEVHLTTSDGTTETSTHDIEFRPHQDVLDLLPYCVVDGKALFALTVTPRPALTTRPDNKNAPECHSGFLLSLPGAYVMPGKRESLTDAAAFILGEKLGLLAVDGAQLEFSCGAAFPSARDSTEQCIRRTVKVEAPAQSRMVSRQEGFACERITQLFSYPELMHEIRSGRLSDLRIIEPLLSFAASHPDLVESEECPPLPLELREQQISSELRDRILSKDEVRTLLGNPRMLPRGIREYSLHEKVQPPNYLTHQSCEAEVVGGDTQNKILGRFDFETVSRHPDKGDNFSCAGLVKLDGEVYVAIREAQRWSIKARDGVAHPIAGEFPPSHFEGIGGVYSVLASEDERSSHVAAYLNKNFGVQLLPDSPLEKVFSGYASAGFNPTLTDLFRFEIDAASAAAWDPSVRLVKLTDYVALSNEGTIRDLALNAAVRLTQTSLVDSQLTAAESHDANATALRNRYLALLDQGSEIHAWISNDDAKRTCVSQLSTDPRIRRLLCLAENELGIVMGIMNNTEESSFFSPTMPLYPLMTHQRGSAVAVLHFIHDLAHYLIGDYIPTPDSNRDDFFNMYHENEIVAGWFSDYVLPSVLGAQRSQQLLGRHSLYDLFEAYGITDEEEAKSIYRSMERDGIIPPKILENPELYARFRETIIQSTLYAQVMFHSHAGAVYDNWVQHPKTAKIAADFSERSFQDTDIQSRIFAESTNQILAQSEGVNPLKAAISRAITRDIQIPVMELAYYAEITEHANQGIPTELTQAAFAKIDEMYAIYKRLTELRSSITNIEASDYNLQIFAELEALMAEGGPFDEFKKYVDRFEKEFLPQEIKSSVEGRIVPFYKKLPFVDKAAIRSQITALEKESFKRAQIPVPEQPMQFS